MKHTIVGYGYSGAYLAQELLMQGHQVIVLSRSAKNIANTPLLTHFSMDVETQALPPVCSDSYLHYFIPPPSHGKIDTSLQQFLILNTSSTFKKILYCGSSGVYGDHQGCWVDEQSECILNVDRQYRRIDAEQQWHRFCNAKNIPLNIFRCAGIFGPNRLPIEACQKRKPVIEKKSAPFINHIYVRDIAKSMRMLCEDLNINGIFNLSDGRPMPMGQLQQSLAKILHLQEASEVDFDSVWEDASPMKREFLQASKRLRIDKLRQALPQFIPTDLKCALQEMALKKELL